MSETNEFNDEQGSKRITDMTIIEIGEKLFQWRDYIAIPILMILLLAGNPTPRSATFGTLLIVFGQIIRIYTIGFLGEEGASREGQTEQVITVGPYSIIRHPLYIGNLVIIAGVICYLASIIFGLASMVFFLFQYHCIAKYEESLLLARHGDDYQRYMERIPAWIPLRLPVEDDFPLPPSISKAIRAERRTIASMAILIFLLMLAGR